MFSILSLRFQGQLLTELGLAQPVGEITSLAGLAGTGLRVLMRPNLHAGVRPLVPPGLALEYDSTTPNPALADRVAHARDVAVIVGEEALPLMQHWVNAW